MTSIKFRPMSEHDWPEVSLIYKQGIDAGKATFQMKYQKAVR